MGWNATVVVNMDALHEIEGDAQFGKRLAEAIKRLPLSGEAAHLYVPAGNHGNAAVAVEQHDSEYTSVLTVGGGLGMVHAVVYGQGGWSPDADAIADKAFRSWAEKLGYDVTKKKG